MRTQKQLYPQTSKVYTCELGLCSVCGQPLERCDYLSGRKTVQTMTTVMQIAYQPKRCPVASCRGHQESLKSARWQQIAPLQGTYGFEVIATIGWQRQTLPQTYAEIQAGLAGPLQISESQVRYLYSYHYHPLKLSRKQLGALKDQWLRLPPDRLSG